MATAAAGGQGLASEVVDAFTSVENSLRRWSVEGPPGNQRSCAAALADKLAEAIANIEGLASTSASMQEERTVNAEKLRDFEAQVTSLKASIAELTSDRETQESRFKQQSSAELAALRKELADQKESSSARVAELEALLLERGSMLHEDTALLTQVQRLRKERSCFEEKLETSTGEINKLRQREATLAAQVASVLAPVSVMCRMRPLTSYHSKDCCESALSVDGCEISVEGVGNIPKRKFMVDHILDGDRCSQDDAFGAVAPWIENVMGGGCSCIMAYGATGSGKTHTLLGADGRGTCPGIAHHALRRLLEGRKGGTVKLSIVEVYCDQIRDLLHESSSSEPQQLQCSRRDARGRVVIDATEAVVSDYSKAEEVLRMGFKNRTADATLCNDQSSRSHVIMTVETCGHSSESSSASGGRLVLIDLAGSENIQKSGADECGKLLTEAKAINKSLSALADVVEAVAKRQTFVPFRNSRLTMLLEDALSTSKVCLLVHVSPLTCDVGNTGQSLSFAGRIRAIDFGAQQLRKDQDERMRAEQARCSQENRRLQARVDDHVKVKAGMEQTQQELQQKIARLSQQCREHQRDLAREQELRSKLEASNRRIADQNTKSQRPASPLLRQQGNMQGVRRPGPMLCMRSQDIEHSPIDVRVEEVDASNVEPRQISSTEGGAAGNATRMPLADVTNCDDRSCADGKNKETKLQSLGASIPTLLKPPEASRQAAEKASQFETPPRSGSQPEKVGCELEAVAPLPRHLEAEITTNNTNKRLTACEAESNITNSNSNRPKGVLRKVPTNFSERIAMRSASCPALGNKDESRIKFAEQLQEASSPPRWYLDWLKGEAEGRREVAISSMKGRETSPRRVRRVPREPASESEGPRWR